jgi:hypothetical protein
MFFFAYLDIEPIRSYDFSVLVDENNRDEQLNLLDATGEEGKLMKDLIHCKNDKFMF